MQLNLGFVFRQRGRFQEYYSLSDVSKENQLFTITHVN